MWRMAGVHCGESGVYVAYFSVVSSCQPRSKNNGTTYQKRNGATRFRRKRVALAHNALQTAPPPLSVTNTTTRSPNIQIPRRARRSTETTIFVIAMPSSLHTAAFEMHHEGEEQMWKVQQTSRSFDPHSREVPHVQTSICTSRSINIPKPWVSALKL
jgi:hypothetical protein